MAREIVLTNPVDADDLRAAFPRALNAVGDAELEIWLEIEERAIRTQYGVTADTTKSDDILYAAMIAAWPSFQQQVRNVSSESASTRGSSINYGKGGDFEFPPFIGSMLSLIANTDDFPAAPSTTELVRS